MNPVGGDTSRPRLIASIAALVVATVPHVQPAFNDATLLDHDGAHADRTGHATRGLDLQAVAAGRVAGDRAADHDVHRLDLGGDLGPVHDRQRGRRGTAIGR